MELEVYWLELAENKLEDIHHIIQLKLAKE